MNEQERYDLFSELLTRDQSRIYGYIIALVRNREDAADLFQTVCLLLWRKFEAFQPGSSFFLWARKASIFEVRNFLKRKKQPTHISDQLLDAFVRVPDEAGHMSCLVVSMPMMAGPLQLVGKYLGNRLWDAGLPVIDDLHTGVLSGGPDGKKSQILGFLHSMKPGITQFIVHCTRASESFPSISASGPMRQAELDAMADPDVKKVIEEEQIILTTWRELKQRRDAVMKQEQAAAVSGR